MYKKLDNAAYGSESCDTNCTAPSKAHVYLMGEDFISSKRIQLYFQKNLLFLIFLDFGWASM